MLTLSATFRHRSAAGAALSLALLLSACGTAAEGDDKEFDVLFIGGITGPTAATVKATTSALEAAAQSINEANGVNGRRIKLHFKNSQADPTRAVSLLQESLSGSNPPDAVIPSGSSAEALALVPLLTRKKIVSVSFGASPLLNDPKKYPYHFQTAPSSAAQLVGLRPLLEKKGIKSLGVLVSKDEYGKGVVQAIKAQMAGSDIKVNAFEFVATDVDLSVSYRRMLATDPGFVFLDTTGEAAVRLMQARVQAGGTNIPTAAGIGMSLTAGGPYKYGSREANTNLEILVFKVEVAVPESSQSPTFKDFYKRYSGGKPIANSLSTPSLAWDELRLLAAAGARPGALDKTPGSLVKAFYDLKMPEGHWLTETQFTYTPDRHTPIPPPDDFPFIPSSPQVNGQYQVKSAS
ncbi:ABC transporter substrate-binding protein [Spirillospora sp. NPDC047279]|uniref:ABC transporter substrate-binding protein n=1 Tax=Spirillospora sp. NPDC047279 TaxID=3155478 RepID=UPI0033DD8524